MCNIFICAYNIYIIYIYIYIHTFSLFGSCNSKVFVVTDPSAWRAGLGTFMYVILDLPYLLYCTWCTVTCYAMLCYAMLRYAMLYYAVIYGRLDLPGALHRRKQALSLTIPLRVGQRSYVHI